jgi:hypothetical protein
VLGALAATVALVLGLPLLSGEPGPGLGSGEIAAVAAGSVICAALCAIMGVAAGVLVRNQVVGVVGALILMYVALPALLPSWKTSSWSVRVERSSAPSATTCIVTASATSPNMARKR